MESKFKVKSDAEEIIAVLVDCVFDDAVLRVYTQERNISRSEKEFSFARVCSPSVIWNGD